ncbi:MAG: conjugative transposon protein TraM [Acidobacteria bacterium]|nr:conjugative transposon protein TraM [Acidobacteriota bacterium]MCI0718111.1 conjugative transposon protein TraM [Acidobacteriota bacterium]
MTKQRIERLRTQAFAGFLMALCVMTASIPSGFAKKGNFRTQEGSGFIPAGTAIHIRMIDELDTGKSVAGDSFRASLSQPIVAGGRTIASKDGLVKGKVTEVVSSGRLKRPASLTLRLTQVTLSNGRMVPVETSPYTLDGKSHALRNAALIGGGAAAGAVLGGVATGKKGAIIGSGVGAGAGLATAYLTGKQEIVVPSETGFQFATTGNTTTAASSRERRSEWENNAVARGNGDNSGWVFHDRDRHTIRDYFRNRYSNLPPGLAKRGGHLPPGLEKQLQRNGKLPPGLQKRIEPFPRDLEIQLPRIPERIRRVILGRRALMLDEGNTILDELTLD